MFIAEVSQEWLVMHFLIKCFIYIYINIASTKQMLNLMYLYILIWKRQVASNDIQIWQTACISPIIYL